MATAALLSLDECRDTQRRAEIRQRLRDRVDMAVARLPEQ